jgi:hypothetical protein
MELEGERDQAIDINTCLLCGAEFIGQMYMTIAPKRKKLEASRIALCVKFQYIMGEDINICWDCSKKCIKEAYDGCKRRRK